MTPFLEFAARGKTAWWRYLVTAALALAAWMALLIALTVISTLAGFDLAGELQRANDGAVFFLLTGLMFGALLLCLIGALRLIQRKRFGDIIGAWRWRLVAWGAGVWLAVQVAATVIDYLLAPHGFSLTASGGTAVMAAGALLGLAAQTFTEEFVFRGFVTQGLLLAIRRPAVAAVISGLMFGALHIPNGWPQAVGAAIFGIITAMIAIRTGGVALTWGLHMANNLYGAVCVVSADDVFKGAPGLISQRTPGLLWWDTGVEAIALLLVLWIVMRHPKTWAATTLTR